MSSVHSSAIVDSKAKIARNAVIGPYCVIGPDVEIGEGTTLASHVHLLGKVVIGKNCQLYTGCVIGNNGQSKSPVPAVSSVRIGDENVLREYVTIHRGIREGSETRLGHRNLLMANAHVAHDCIVGDDIVMANLVTLAGHVEVGDKAVLGGLSGVHQFVRIGTMAMVGGMSKVVQDVVPFAMVDGRPATFRGVNAVGMRRAGFDSAARLAVKKMLVQLCRAGVSNGAAQSSETSSIPPVETVINFIKGSKRGITRFSVTDSDAGEEED